MNSKERAMRIFWFLVTICITILAWKMIDAQKTIAQLQEEVWLEPGRSMITENNLVIQSDFRQNLLNHVKLVGRVSASEKEVDIISDGIESQNAFYYSRLWEIKERVDVLEAVANFPYVDQVGDDAIFKDDCGSAAILMIAKYYGVAGDETVNEIHQDMAGGDYPVTWILVTDYLESRYGLETKVITNYDWVLIALENNGFDISEIELVDSISDDEPIIWVYATEAHWIVRYQGWAFDPLNGIWPFQATAAQRRISEPQWGLGIIVIEEGDEW